ncbi:Crossover junction endonuclease mus81, partial [Massospora cicadina]
RYAPGAARSYLPSKAIDALSKYPLPLAPKDTIQLNGIGPKIAEKLEQKWQEHLKHNPHLAPLPRIDDSAATEGQLAAVEVPPEASGSTEAAGQTTTKKKRPSKSQTKDDSAPKKRKEYVPRHRTGGFAILMGLRCGTPSQIRALGKWQKDLSERLSQVNRTLTDPSARHDSLHGSSVAGELAGESDPSTPTIPQSDRNTSPQQNEIVLVLDNREVRGKKDRDYFQAQLDKKGVVNTTRALSLGDALWIARPHVSSGPHEEIVLDFIIERKNMDDFASSIKDGRFKEQKFRLKNCGAKTVIYLVEGFSIKDSAKFATNPQTFWTSLAQTLVSDGFCLKMTPTMDDSLDYLARMTRQIKAIYEGHVIEGLQNETLSRSQFLQLQASGRLPRDTGLTLATFLQLNDKSKYLTLREVFLKMLMTCRGLSLSKATEIVKRYPTPTSLADAFDQLSPGERSSLLAISNPIQSRSISAFGPKAF